MTPISEFQLQQMQARLKQNKIRQAPGARAAAPDGVERERGLHEEILLECSARGWLAVHSRMDAPSTVSIGCPDFVILRDGGRTLLVEAKRRDGKLSVAQRAWLAWASKLGHPAGVVRSFSEFLQLAEGK